MAAKLTSQYQRLDAKEITDIMGEDRRIKTHWELAQRLRSLQRKLQRLTSKPEDEESTRICLDTIISEHGNLGSTGDGIQERYNLLLDDVC